MSSKGGTYQERHPFCFSLDFNAVFRVLKTSNKLQKSRSFQRKNGFIWSEWRDLNSRPLDPQSSTLPAALHPDLQRSIKPCLNRIPNPEGKVKCFVKIPAINLRHAACFERRRTVNPSETAYTLREPIANTAITIKTSNPSAAESAPDS